MQEIKLPQLGQSVEEASIIEWLKSEGDQVAQGEPICSIQTDKAEIEVESTATGVLRKILVDPGQTVPVLSVIALVGGADEPLPDLSKYQLADSAPAAQPREAGTDRQAVAVAEKAVQNAVSAGPGGDGGRGLVSPRARKRAEELHVPVAVLRGTGPDGRVVESDVLDYAAGIADVKITPTARRLAVVRSVDITGVTGTGKGGKITKSDIEKAEPVSSRGPSASQGERVPLTPMRSVIAKRMTESKFTAPHYYVTVEVDMHNATERFRRKDSAFRPSFNDLVIAAVVKGLGEHREINAAWDGDTVIIRPDINIGVAVALPAGLIVPVLKGAQHMSLEQINAGCRALVEKAREGKLLPDDYTGNTFTVSNLGVFGVDDFTAIINQPDSAILAVGRIKQRPVVIDGGIYIRPVMKMTMSSDHRVIDGAMAARFMGRVKEILETADL